MPFCNITSLAWDASKGELGFDFSDVSADVGVSRWGTRIVKIGDRECSLSAFLKEKQKVLKSLPVDWEQHKCRFNRAVVFALVLLPLRMYEESEVRRQKMSRFVKFCCLIQDVFRGIVGAVRSLERWKTEMQTFPAGFFPEEALRRMEEAGNAERTEDGRVFVKSVDGFENIPESGSLDRLGAAILQAEEHIRCCRELAESEARDRA